MGEEKRFPRVKSLRLRLNFALPSTARKEQCGALARSVSSFLGENVGYEVDNGERMLRLRRFRAARCDRFARAYFTIGEPLVASLQAAESVIGGDRGSGVISGKRPTAQGHGRH